MEEKSCLARTDRILHSFELKQSPVDDPTKHNTTTGTPSTSTSTSSASTAPNPYTRPNPLTGKGMRASFSNIAQSSLAMSKERPLSHSRAPTREEIKEPSTISKISTGWVKRDKSKAKSKEALHPNDADDDNTATKPAISTTIIEKDMWIFDGQVSYLQMMVSAGSNLAIVSNQPSFFRSPRYLRLPTQTTLMSHCYWSLSLEIHLPSLIRKATVIIRISLGNTLVIATIDGPMIKLAIFQPTNLIAQRFSQRPPNHLQSRSISTKLAWQKLLMVKIAAKKCMACL